MYLLKVNSLLFWATVYTMSQKTPPYNFLNNWVKNEPSWIIFTTQNSEETWRK